MKTTIQARVSVKLKDDVTQILSENGLTMTQAIRLIFNKIAREKQFNFDVFAPNQETIDAMNEDTSKMKSFNNVEELMADLNADD